MQPFEIRDKRIVAGNIRGIFRACLFVFLGVSIWGCSGHEQNVVESHAVISGDVAGPAVNSAAAPAASSEGVINAQMYQLQMPFRANSRDEAFWKLVDEDVVDVPTSRRLNSNGLRVGRGRVADWPEFLKVLEKESAIKLAEHRISAESGIGDAPLEMTDVMPEELLYIYDEHGLTMRSFADCQNELSLAFQWAARKPGTLRVTVCPVVVASQTRFDYSLRDDPRPVKYLDRENYYDLHLCADIGPGEFLVIGTSTATEDPNRIGSRFLTRDGPNQRFEKVLILVGQSIPMDRMRSHARPATRPAAAGGLAR